MAAKQIHFPIGNPGESPARDRENRPVGVVSMNDIARLAARAKKSGVDRELVETLAAVCQPRAAIHPAPSTNNIVVA